MIGTVSRRRPTKAIDEAADDDERRDQPVQPEPFQPVRQRIEQIGEDEAGDEGQQDLVQQKQRGQEDDAEADPESRPAGTRSSHPARIPRFYVGERSHRADACRPGPFLPQRFERCVAPRIVPEWAFVTSRGSDHGSDPRVPLQAGGQPDGSGLTA